MIAQGARVVVKVGTSTLTHDTGKINIRFIEKLATVLSELMNSGNTVALVTSGAIGVGLSKLKLAARPEDTAGKQAVSTVGQCELMYYYDKSFIQYGYNVGQLLITKEDIDDEKRKCNLIAAFDKLFSYGVIPIINENDAVAVEEIVFGDNDSLSAHVAKLINADALIILTETNGLYDKDPTIYPDAKRIPLVEEIDESIFALAGKTKTDLGTGGMQTKLNAAKIATQAGIDTYIISGEEPENIYKLFESSDVGTRFAALK